MSNSGRETKKESSLVDNKSSLVDNRQHETNREDKLRAERVPLHKQNTLTLLNPDKNFAYRWVNDTYGRIEAFKCAGWEIVEGDIQHTYSGKGREIETQRGSQIWRTVNKKHDAPSKEAVLMRIPIEIFNEDQANKMEKIDADEKRIDPDGVVRKAQLMGSHVNIRRNN